MRPPPDLPLGAPIEAPDGVWTQVLFPEGYCRDDTPAHLMVHPNGKSKKIAIYLEGGGACFSDLSCTLFTSNLPSYVLGNGIFDFKNPNNPIGDWNVFYVPYCSGDVHAGANENGIPGPLTGAQKFTGHTNLRLYLSRILATVPDATDELLAGTSAGGYGAGLNASLVARNAPATAERITVLDDSGPPLSKEYLSPCLLDGWRRVWGFDNTFLKECGAACPARDDFVFDWIRYLLGTYAQKNQRPSFMAGLLSRSGDSAIGGFLGFGANDCASAFPTSLTSAQIGAGLLELRARLQQLPTSSFGTFYAPGTSHGFLATSGFYSTQVGEVKLVDWVSDLLAHAPATHIGP